MGFHKCVRGDGKPGYDLPKQSLVVFAFICPCSISTDRLGGAVVAPAASPQDTCS